MSSPSFPAECRIIGNLGDNHNGNSELARRLTEIAASTGCDAVVLPYRKPGACYTEEALLQPTPDGSMGSTTLGEKLRTLELPFEAVKDLREWCRGRLSFIAAPYDLDAFSELQEIHPDGYQVDPPVLGHLPLLQAIGSTGSPVLLVAGACTEQDISAAIAALGHGSITILHSIYARGVDLGSTALWYIPALREKFHLPVGYLGLEGGISGAIAAFALGARTIEKVFTSDRFLPGPAHSSSLDRDELRQLVCSLRSLEKAVSGSVPRVPLLQELESADEFHPSLVATADLTAGVTLDESMLSVKLGTSGLRPRLIQQVVGRRLAYDVLAGTPLTFGVLEE